MCLNMPEQIVPRSPEPKAPKLGPSSCVFSPRVCTVCTVYRRLRCFVPRFSLLVAGVGHDIGHMGLNNGFLSEAGLGRMDGERVQPGVQRLAHCRCGVQTLSTESLESGESKSLSSQESLLSQWFEMPLFHIVPMSFPAPQKMRAEECREKWQSRCTFCQVGHELAIKYNDKSPLENMPLEFDSNSLKFSMQLLPCKPHSSVMSL